MPVSDLVKLLLSKRGIESENDISAFLNPDYEAHTHSPALLPDIEKAVDRVLHAIEAGERIAVYADFDCDGIPGAALLADFFEKIQHNNIEVYIPHRDREGYGFHQEAIQELGKRGVSLIITVDVGTVAHESILFGNTLGIDTIVTDHHEISASKELPQAFALLNPMREGYPFSHLCGAAVAFKLVQATLAEGRRREIPQFLAVAPGWEKWLLDLVGIATVADMVPLIGENRVLARFGVSVLRKSPRPGIIALCEKLRLRKNDLTEDDIGFSIAPRINAASRMGEPDLAFRLLRTRDSNEAEQIVAALEQLNTRRKTLVGSIVREVKKRVRERFTENDRVVVLGNPEWKPALLGLAANSIVGERGGIACLWGRDAKGRLKGSCRSDGKLSIIDLFAEAPGAVIEYGGHRASGGFSVSHENVHELPEALSAAAERLAREKHSAPTAMDSDAVATLSQMSISLYRDVSSMAPFGMSNPKPVFRIDRILVSDVRRFGRDKNHIELKLSCRETGAEARAFDFFRTPESFTHVPSPGVEASLLATIERDTFRGASSVALRLLDVLPARS